MNFFSALIHGYQIFISPVLGVRCRFYPSCSEYLKQAVNSQGFLQGVRLGIQRLLRCHSFAAGGYDPAPAPAGVKQEGKTQ